MQSVRPEHAAELAAEPAAEPAPPRASPTKPGTISDAIADVVAAEQPLAVALAGIRFACLFVHLEDKDPAGI